MTARIGDILPNGATIVDIRHDGAVASLGSFGAVLAVRSHPWHPYVVWTFNRAGDTVDTYHTHHGAYFDDLNEAVNEFDARCRVRSSA